ncbi:hypothetical protein Nepgr_010710 [Nepenthes gracilis]|uniref:3'-5' exonuclease domain-containing protein n=1 Tax=Nepenthes gracilis TaxID=150966 RepID=A0AAD3SCU0_NEPGR|nr:hypothetical protein Nepgr_010710 [Nepenthes gracilis]
MYPTPQSIHWVSGTDSPEFALLSWALTRSSRVALDAEWKPIRSHNHQTRITAFPAVSLLQLACRLCPGLAEFPPDLADPTHFDHNESLVFLVDLQSVPLNSVYGLLREMFVCPDILKLGFRFKQDFVYLSSTFCSQGCDPGFDRVEPFLDITSIYNLLQQKQLGRKASKESKSLATICQELLGVSLSKELQCSDWSRRPLTEQQKTYAAADAHCLLEIFVLFQVWIDKGNSEHNVDQPPNYPNLRFGLTEILEKPTVTERILHNKFCEASNVVRAAAASEICKSFSSTDAVSVSLCRKARPLDESVLKILKKYGSKIVLQESDRKPRTSRKKSRKQFPLSLASKVKHLDMIDDWQGPPPWALSLGGNGCPKFLCDVMVEGLAKHLRCVGIDAAVPYSKKPESRELIDQIQREKRVLLTRDAKLLRHDYLVENQIYRIKSLLKNEQLLEVIETFQLKISEDQLMSRCTKCNGRFIQRPLTTEEAVEAAKGFQKIPDCLFNKNLEFWQCMDCNQLYWEGTQYHNAVQKFIIVCKLND